MDNNVPRWTVGPLILLLAVAGWVLVIGAVALAAGVLGMLFDS